MIHGLGAFAKPGSLRAKGRARQFLHVSPAWGIMYLIFTKLIRASQAAKAPAR
jgi:hypothetical protein